MGGHPKCCKCENRPASCRFCNRNRTTLRTRRSRREAAPFCLHEKLGRAIKVRRRPGRLLGLGLEEENFFSHDFDAVALDAIAVRPLRIVQATLDFDEVALLLVVRN